MAPKGVYSPQQLQRVAALSADGVRGELANTLTGILHDLTCEYPPPTPD